MTGFNGLDTKGVMVRIALCNKIPASTQHQLKHKSRENKKKNHGEIKGKIKGNEQGVARGLGRSPIYKNNLNREKENI